jgi:hypothetical protein
MELLVHGGAHLALLKDTQHEWRTYTTASQVQMFDAEELVSNDEFTKKDLYAAKDCHCHDHGGVCPWM